MCPDKELLSAYFDGEVDTVWKARIGKHIETCEKCKQILKSFESLHTLLQTEELPINQEKRESIYQSVTSKETPAVHFWDRRVSLPAPIALAAAALFVVFGGFIFSLMDRASPTSPEGLVFELSSVSAYGKEWERDIFPVTELSGDITDTDFLIALPTHSGFTVQGEPKFILATEYKRGK